MPSVNVIIHPKLHWVIDAREVAVVHEAIMVGIDLHVNRVNGHFAVVAVGVGHGGDDDLAGLGGGEVGAALAEKWLPLR